jgi:hypothetical protein
LISEPEISSKSPLSLVIIKALDGIFGDIFMESAVDVKSLIFRSLLLCTQIIMAASSILDRIYSLIYLHFSIAKGKSEISI